MLVLKTWLKKPLHLALMSVILGVLAIGKVAYDFGDIDTIVALLRILVDIIIALIAARILF